MTEDEQRLADDKMRVEIARLISETTHMDAKMRAEIAKLNAEAKQIGVNTFLAPTLAAAALMGATAAFVKIFLT